MERTIETSGFFFNINTVFGPFPFVCFGVTDGDRDYLLKRAGDSLVAGGRMPTPGQPEAVISEGLARNKKVKIGDIIASPLDTGTFVAAPAKIKLVGILRGPTWMAFTSQKFTDASLSQVPRSLLVTTRDPLAQGTVGDTLFDKLDKFQVQVLSFNNLVKTLRSSLASMYLIMHLVNGTVIFVVALMAGMLSNIYFTQRISEFAVLAAIGIRRSTLVWHAVSETAILTSLGWILGVIVNWSILSLMRGSVFEPRGMLINPSDPLSYWNTLPIPVCITAVRRGDHFLPPVPFGPGHDHRKTIEGRGCQKPRQTNVLRTKKQSRRKRACNLRPQDVSLPGFLTTPAIERR